MTNRREFLLRTVPGLAFYSALVEDGRAAGASRVPKIKITDVKSARFRNMGNGFVRIYTDQGITGTGEMINEIGAVETINKFIAPKLKGQDPLDIERIYLQYWDQTFDRGLGGPLLSAASAIDVALWDIAGKVLGVPIYRLFGGPVRDKILVYFHHHYTHPAKEAAEMVRKTGVKAFKTGVEMSRQEHLDPSRATGRILSNRQIQKLADYVASLREAVGPDIEIALECHALYSTESAIQLARAVEPYRPMFFEEPIGPENPDAMALVRRSTRIPIAAGENIYTRWGFRPFLEQQALSIIQPDMLKCGGLLETRKIAAMAEIYGVPIAPHSIATPLGKIAMSHICATVPNFMIQEWSTWEYGQIFTTPADYRDGYVHLSDKPGIGIELVEDLVKERLLPGYEFPPA